MSMVRAALDREGGGGEGRSGLGELCHSPSRIISSRCEVVWPLRQKGVRAALRAQPRG